MANFLPNHLRSDAPKGEKKVFESFRLLDSSWYVFSNVIWQSVRNGRQGDGEIDFLLLNEHVGLLIVEVKGGSIEIKDGEWFSTGGDGRHQIKNPFQQASENKYGLLKILTERSLSSVPVNYAICFPDCSERID